MKGRPYSATVTAGALAALFVGLWVIHHRIGGPVGYDLLVTHLAGTPLSRVWAALLLSLASYAVVVSYDVVALRHIGRIVTLSRVAIGSFATYVVNHSVGPGLLTGGGLSYRMLAADGLAASEIADVMAVNLVTFWLAVLFLGGAALIVTPLDLPERLPDLEPVSRTVGAL